MILIAHRGNTSGKLENWENEPTYIDLAIKKGFQVEVDVWYKDDNILWLGHDTAQYGIDSRWLIDRIDKLWIHCKDLKTFEYFHFLKRYHKFNYFYHTDEDAVLTSKQYMWVYPGNQPIDDSIAVLPELYADETGRCTGICSDYIENYKNG